MRGGQRRHRENGRRWEQRHTRYQQGSRNRGRRERARAAEAARPGNRHE